MRVLVLGQELAVEILLGRSQVLVLDELRVLSVVHYVMIGCLVGVGGANQDARSAIESHIGVEMRCLDWPVRIVLHQKLARHELFHLSLTLADLVQHGLTRALDQRVLTDAVNHEIGVIVHVRAAPAIPVGIRLAGWFDDFLVSLVVED